MEDTAIIHGIDPHANKGAGAVEGHIVHDHAMEAARVPRLPYSKTAFSHVPTRKAASA